MQGENLILKLPKYKCVTVTNAIIFGSINNGKIN